MTLDDVPRIEQAVQTRLLAIADVRGVNGLATGQRLVFEDGLNVVFADNGGGKTSYFRLIQAAAGDAAGATLLPDVYARDVARPRGAQFVFEHDQDRRELLVDLADTPPPVLSAIETFDASSASASLETANVIEHVPRPLRLFDRMARAQDRLRELLSERLEELDRAAYIWPDPVPGGALEKLRLTLDERTTTTQLDEILGSTTELEERLDETRRLHRQSAMPDDGNARRRCRAVRRLDELLEGARRALGSDVAERHRVLRQQLLDRLTAQESAAQVFAGLPVPGVGGEVWKQLWESAREFVAAHDAPFPPEGGDATCPLCHQPLDADAQDRFGAFEHFVQHDIAARVHEARSTLDAARFNLPDLQLIGREVKGILDGLPDELPVGTIIAQLAELEIRRAQMLSSTVMDDSQLNVVPRVDLAPTIARLEQEEERLTALRDPAQRAQLELELRRLEEQLRMREQREGLVREVERLRLVGRLRLAHRELDSRSVSAAGRRFGEELVTAKLAAALPLELDLLGYRDARVMHRTSGSKGTLRVTLDLDCEQPAKVRQVLSDGEQRTLATAFALAEATVTSSRGPLVFDDPVSSLDQQRRRYVARRLLDEANKRQVIVFTHDLAFLYEIQREGAFSGREAHFQLLRRSADRAGIVRHELPWAAKSVEHRVKALRKRLQEDVAPLHGGSEYEAYERAAREWCLDLRDTWERAVEDKVLASVVVRHQPQIQTQRLGQINLDQEVVSRVNVGMTRTSSYAHDAPRSAPVPALTPGELGQLLSELDDLLGLLSGKPARLPVGAA